MRGLTVVEIFIDSCRKGMSSRNKWSKDWIRRTQDEEKKDKFKWKGISYCRARSEHEDKKHYFGFSTLGAFWNSLFIPRSTQHWQAPQQQWWNDPTIDPTSRNKGNCWVSSCSMFWSLSNFTQHCKWRYGGQMVQHFSQHDMMLGDMLGRLTGALNYKISSVCTKLTPVNYWKKMRNSFGFIWHFSCFF